MKMKTILPKVAFIAVLLCSAISSNAQTPGTLSFTFTPVTKSPGYSGTKNYLAVWIQDNTGKFIKTKYATNKGAEADHLPTWAKISSNNATTNCTSASCNVVDATTSATLGSFTKKTMVWDGKNVSGTTVADGVITVKIEECWNHGGSATKTYTFTKGPNPDHQMPADDANFTGAMLDWLPTSTVNVDEVASVNPVINVYPNPTEGIFNVEFKNAQNIKVINSLGVVVYDEKVEQLTEGIKHIDLSHFSNGVYFINVSNGINSSNHKVLLNK